MLKYNNLEVKPIVTDLRRRRCFWFKKEKMKKYAKTNKQTNKLIHKQTDIDDIIFKAQFPL